MRSTSTTSARPAAGKMNANATSRRCHRATPHTVRTILAFTCLGELAPCVPQNYWLVRESLQAAWVERQTYECRSRRLDRDCATPGNAEKRRLRVCRNATATGFRPGKEERMSYGGLVRFWRFRFFEKHLLSAGSGIGPGLCGATNPVSSPARRETSFRT